MARIRLPRRIWPAAALLLAGPLAVSEAPAQDPPPLEAPLDLQVGPGVVRPARPELQPAVDSNLRRASAPSAPARAMVEGPLHEAFLSPARDREPARVDRSPPPPVRERPGVDRPSPEAEWLDGYWSWDAGRGDFVWVTGTWRVPPPGRFWVNGYWKRDDQGWYRAVGFWSDRQTDRVDFRKTGPPADAPEEDPGEAPSTEAFWVPGHFAPEGDEVEWKPGYWAKKVAGWAWVPAQWVRQPEGWTFQEGYWDRNLEDRGTLFAPAEVDSQAREAGEVVYEPIVQIAPQQYSLLYGALGRVDPAYDGYPGCYFDPAGQYYGYADYGSIGMYNGYLDYPFFGSFGYPYLTPPVALGFGYPAAQGLYAAGINPLGFGYSSAFYGSQFGYLGTPFLGGFGLGGYGLGLGGFGFGGYGLGLGGFGFGGFGLGGLVGQTLLATGLGFGGWGWGYPGFGFAGPAFWGGGPGWGWGGPGWGGKPGPGWRGRYPHHPGPKHHDRWAGGPGFPGRGRGDGVPGVGPGGPGRPGIGPGRGLPGGQAPGIRPRPGPATGGAAGGPAFAGRRPVAPGAPAAGAYASPVGRALMAGRGAPMVGTNPRPNGLNRPAPTTRHTVARPAIDNARANLSNVPGGAGLAPRAGSPIQGRPGNLAGAGARPGGGPGANLGPRGTIGAAVPGGRAPGAAANLARPGQGGVPPVLRGGPAAGGLTPTTRQLPLAGNPGGVVPTPNFPGQAGLGPRTLPGVGQPGGLPRGLQDGARSIGPGLGNAGRAMPAPGAALSPRGGLGASVAPRLPGGGLGGGSPVLPRGGALPGGFANPGFRGGGAPALPRGSLGGMPGGLGNMRPGGLGAMPGGISRPGGMGMGGMRPGAMGGMSRPGGMGMGGMRPGGMGGARPGGAAGGGRR